MKLVTTTTPFRQPDNTYRFALNAVTDFESLGSLTNEKGTTERLDLPAAIKGSVYMYDQKHTLFLADNSICVVDLSNNSLEVVVQLDEFGFDELGDDEYVTGIYIKHRGCDDVVMFFDGKHTNKYINISRPDIHKTDGLFDINLFEFNPKFIYPDVTTEVIEGGSVLYGRFKFIIEFFDKAGNVVIRTPLSNDYVIIDVNEREGALNIDQYFDKIGGKNPSNKAIKLTVDNVPSFVHSARVIAIRYVYGDGKSFDTVVSSQKYSVSNGKCVLYYRGFNPSQGDFYDTIDKYIVPKVIYNIASDGLLVENHLVLYNLKEKKRDYSTYQKYASKIHAKYVVEEVPEEEAPDNNRTFAGNEILAVFIHYVFKDGSISPGFPIIGRPKKAVDEEQLLDPITNEYKPAWQLKSTIIPDEVPEEGYYASGELGYFETEDKYEKPVNFCGTDYWGTDYEGNSLQDTNIRFLRMPGRYDIPHVKYIEGKAYIYKLGLKFDNIEYPGEDVVGHFFSIANAESNIVNTGLNFLLNGSYRLFGAYNLESVNLDKSWFIGDNVWITNGRYSTRFVYNGAYRTDTELQEGKYKIFHSDLPYKKIRLDTYYTRPTSFVSQYDIFEVKRKIPFLYPRTEMQNIRNVSYSNTLTYIQSDRPYTNRPVINVSNVDYITFDTGTPPVFNLFGVRTTPITDINENVSFRGNWFICPADIDNIARVTVDDDDLVDRVLIFFGADSKIDAEYEFLQDFYVESRANLFKRHQGIGPCYIRPTSKIGLQRIALSKLVEPYNGEYKLRDSFCNFFVGYNKDYSILNDPFVFESIGWNYDFCSECISEFPTRYAWSQLQSTEEQNLDLLVFLAANYYDLPQDTGEIVKIDYVSKKLIIRTKEAAYVTQPTPRNLKIEDDNVAIGTGEFLSIEPIRVNINTTGYGGQQNKIDSILCDRGLVWINTRTKEVHLFNGKFDDLHVDIFNVLRDHIKEVPTLFAYDNENKRIIMSNKDNITLSYCFITGGWKSFHSYIPKYMFYDYMTFYSVYKNKVFSHDNEQRNNFYWYSFPFVFESILRESNTFIPTSTYIYMEITDEEGNVINDESVTRFLAYNSQQSTGIQETRVNDIRSIYFDPGVIHVKITDKVHKISPIRDYSESNDIWTDDISSIKVGDNQGWMDKLPVVNHNKDIIAAGVFRDKWLAVRGFYDKHNRVKVEIAQTLYNISKR